MAANYWESSQFQRFLLTRYELAEAEAMHAAQMTRQELRIGKRLRARQEINAAAHVYFKRFYINNTFYDIDPYLMAATCVFLACKSGECPQHTKYVLSEAKAVFAEVSQDIRFPYDAADIAECESYLLEEMKFYLVLHHPYQALIDINQQAGLQKASLQAAWSIINDSYRTDMALVYPPHVIAVAALFLSRVVDQGGQPDAEAQQWYADLNVDITDVLQVVGELLAVYEVWKGYTEDKMPNTVSRYIADIAATA
ncbi:RNA polymerase II holoenzyme cyclin-like subunit [Coemansia javaensis]|uniref:RNA polymerase II holoenzyme cyclin-like subunit n=1 Tax=Coemansia javaensis TaxID=2761396 RepID=A0A9W8HLN0_9FUNG|nr:RNA polymerase II holoenzyme cyclin-like subunit [Coemansia javaensis]